MSAVVRVAEVETVTPEGIIPKKVTLRGKLAGAVAASLPLIRPDTFGQRTVGYVPLGIECTSTSGHDASGPVVSCAIPTTSLGMSVTLADAVKDGMPKEEAEMLIRTLVPQAT